MTPLDVYTNGPDSIGAVTAEPYPCPACRRMTTFWCQWIDRDRATLTTACYDCHARRTPAPPSK